MIFTNKTESIVVLIQDRGLSCRLLLLLSSLKIILISSSVKIGPKNPIIYSAIDSTVLINYVLTTPTIWVAISTDCAALAAFSLVSVTPTDTNPEVIATAIPFNCSGLILARIWMVMTLYDVIVFVTNYTGVKAMSITLELYLFSFEKMLDPVSSALLPEASSGFSVLALAVPSV